MILHKNMRFLSLKLAVFLFMLIGSVNAGVIFVDVAASGADDGTSWTDAKNDLENKNILGYVKNKMNVYKIKQLKNNPEVIDKCNRLGILIPEI